jgi:hypothetical protein
MNHSSSDVYYKTSTYSIRSLIIIELKLNYETCQQADQIKELGRFLIMTAVFFINNVNSFLTISLNIVVFTLLLNSLLYL